MPRNVEIKARLPNPTKSSEVAKNLSSREGSLLVQEDTFFNVPHGRLKLRQETDSKAKLIQYSRPDKEGPKLSEYHITCVEVSMISVSIVRSGYSSCTFFLRHVSCTDNISIIVFHIIMLFTNAHAQSGKGRVVATVLSTNSCYRY